MDHVRGDSGDSLLYSGEINILSPEFPSDSAFFWNSQIFICHDIEFGKEIFIKINMYHTALRALIGIKHRLNIVIVGANDGKINDPIYNFAMRMSGRTNILLIEPNKALLPYLQNNYSPHPSYQIANYAIGKEGMLTLYAIKKECWNRFRPAYAKGWPSYRAATGITSSIKSHLEKALVRENMNPDDMIDILNIPSKQLKTLLVELKWPSPIDVLQIDAEGCDDLVIHASNLEYTKPKILYFENDNIPQERMESLLIYLSKHHYKTYKIGRNSLSVGSSIDLTCISLNGIILIFRVIRKLAVVMKGLIRGWEQERNPTA